MGIKPEGKDTFPSQFGRYTLVERLATGGMAEVFKAKILSTHGFEKLLVIKRILPHLAADRTFVSMFIDEAKLTAQLVHPKIVQVTDFGEVEGQYFIALEFVDGFDALALLRTSAQRQVRLPLPICMFITHEMLDALDYAHNARDASGKSMNIVHRDISPSNVFIARRGDVKLGDFGIAHAQERESKTQAGTLKGKYGYMSPEQVVGASLDGRSDLFAVGIVLAEMLMGRRLFTAPNDLDVLLMVRDGRLDRLDKYCKDLPPELDHVLRKALKKRVSERFQTAAEFRDALADLLFKFQMRIGPQDLGRLAADYFDAGTPEGVARLKEHVKKFQVRAPSVPSPKITPPPQSITNVSGQRVEWGLTPPPAPAPSEVARPRSGQVTETVPEPPPLEVDVVIDEPSLKPRSRQAPAAAAAPSGANILAALDQALSHPLAIVELDQYEAPSSASGSQPALGAAPPSGSLQAPSPSSGSRGPALRQTPDSGPALAGRSADDAGDLSVISPLRVLATLGVSGDTALVRFESAATTREIYLVRGAPESVTAGGSGQPFGEYLVARGFLRVPDLEKALAQMSRFGGKIAETIVGLGMLKQLDVFRLLSQHVRERVMEVFGWSTGTFSLYRGARNPVESFPLGLDMFEILGAGVLTLPLDFLQGRFAPLADFRPRAAPQPRIGLETFRLGTRPRELWSALDGRRTIRDWVPRFGSSADLLTFLRILYLLLETDLATLE